MKNPGIGFEIYDKPATQVAIRYLEVNPGVTDVEREVRRDWEGRNIGTFAPISVIDIERGTMRVWVWDIGREAILF